MKRRKFLKNTLALTSVISISTLPLINSCSDSPNNRALLHDFLSQEDLTGIINEYLSQPKKFDELNIESENKISNMIKDDFIKGNIIICNGWVLSQTELEYLIQTTNN